MIYLLLSGKYNYLFSFRAASHFTGSSRLPLKWRAGMEAIASLSVFFPTSFVFLPSQSTQSLGPAPSTGLWDSLDLTCPSRLIQPATHPLSPSVRQPVSRSVLPPHSPDKHFLFNCRSETSALAFHTARHFPALSNHSALQLPTSAGNQ